MFQMTTDQIDLPDAPAIDRLTFRLFQDESDYAYIVELVNACAMADGVDDHVTLEWVANYLAHIAGFDPRRDILFAAIDHGPVGWVRGWIRQLDDGARACQTTGGVLPQWRRRGIGLALQHWAEGHLRAMASQSTGGACVYRSSVPDRELGTTALLEHEGYVAVRYGFEMARSFAEPIPNLPLPVGLEVCSVQPKQYRQVYAAMNEAFRDHWGHSESTELDYLRWLNSPNFQPHLWQVGWAGDEVAGMVLNYIDAEYNEKFKRLSGWTDPICVRRPWRKQGLAKALITRSMHVLKDEGMTEVRLGVDADNPNGALRLYESLGYRQTMRFLTYEKPMVVV